MNADGKNYINLSFPRRGSGQLASFEAWAFLKLSSTRFFPQIAQFDQGTNRQEFRPSPSISAFICVICGHEIPWSMGNYSNQRR
jgi:hypothetical protein